MRPIVIGAGHNGLAAAFYLAKAGLKPLVLEAADDVGGGAVTREIHPGYRVPTFTHEVLLHDDIVRDMQLEAHGLQRLVTDVERIALSPSGPPIVIYADAPKTGAGLKRGSPADAAAWTRYCEAMTHVVGVLAPLLTAAPTPMTTRPGLGDIWELLKAGRRFRGIGRRHAQDLLRWLPMPLYDFTHEWFETERLRALVAADGLSGSMLAPRSAGGTLALLLRLAHRHLAGGRPLLVRGGPGACMQAMAAAASGAGAEIRTATRVDRILTGDGRVTGVVANGQEIGCDAVLSSLDPKTTCLSLVEAQALPADFLQRIRNYRSAGTMAKVNLALDALPFLHLQDAAASPMSPEMLGGRLHIGERLDDLERAFDHIKYGELSEQPWLDISLPSVIDGSLAPAGSHVASIYVHNAPERLRAQEWTNGRDLLLERTLRILEGVAPAIRSHVVAAQVLTPADLAHQPGTWGGHIFHGELAPDQLMGLRPTLDSGTYRMPLAGLYLCGAGTHPGGFATGASGRLAVRQVLKDVRR